MIKAICAVNNLGYIGKDGKLMWRSKEDFKHFKASTMGGILIVGRKTFENDFGGKGLPGRTCVVIGKDHYSPFIAVLEAVEMRKKAILRNSEREELIARNVDVTDIPEVKIPEIWVVGGGTIYEQMMPFISEFHLSRINDDQVGDTKLDISKFRGNLIEYNFEVNE